MSKIDAVYQAYDNFDKASVVNPDQFIDNLGDLTALSEKLTAAVKSYVEELKNEGESEWNDFMEEFLAIRATWVKKYQNFHWSEENLPMSEDTINEENASQNNRIKEETKELIQKHFGFSPDSTEFMAVSLYLDIYKSENPIPDEQLYRSHQNKS